MQCAIIKNKAQIPENVQNYPQYQEQNLSQNYPQFDENATTNYDSPRVNIAPTGEGSQNFTQSNPHVSITQSANFDATQNQDQTQ